MSQNKIFIYLRSTVLRVAYKTREISEEITDVLVAQLSDSLKRSTQNARAVVDQSTITDDINYTVDLASGPPSGFYVDTNDPSASDSNSGTAALPWKTIQKAVATLTAGQTCYVKNGTYINNSGTWTNPGDLNPANSGTAGNPIAFRAYPGHTPIVRNNQHSAGSGGNGVIGCNGPNYIIWDGFEVISANPRGVVVWNSTGSVIERCNVHGMRGPNGNNTDGIRVENSTDCIVRNNHIHDCRNVDDSANGTGVKIYDSNGIIVHNNECHDCGAGFRDKSGGNNTTFRNNWIYDITDYAIQHSRPGECYSNIVENCSAGVDLKDSGRPVCYNNVFANLNYRPLSPTTSDPNGDFYNNIMYNCGQVPDTSQIDYCDFNCYYLGPSGCGADVTADPEFVSTSFSDPDHFKLQGGSPCAGAGQAGVDIGAYPTGTELIGRNWS
jgi:hypothetical protein